MKKLYFVGLPVLLVTVISGVFCIKNTSVAKSNGLTEEQIYEIHKEYIESTYGPDTGFSITSYGESGIGYINHETGEVTWNVTNIKRSEAALCLSNIAVAIGTGSESRLSFYPFEFHMTTVPITELEIDYIDKKIMTAENVDVRGIPCEYGAVNRTLSYEMVKVYAAVYRDDGIWALICASNFDSALDDAGWVKISDLMEYTEDNYRLLRYPVQVREGCVDLDTGEPVEWDAFCVDYIGDCAEVSREGGRSYRVSPDDIVYPGFMKE